MDLLKGNVIHVFPMSCVGPTLVIGWFGTAGIILLCRANVEPTFVNIEWQLGFGPMKAQHRSNPII